MQCADTIRLPQIRLGPSRHVTTRMTVVRVARVVTCRDAPCYPTRIDTARHDFFLCQNAKNACWDMSPTHTTLSCVSWRDMTGQVEFGL